jgi:hypothetical protein
MEPIMEEGGNNARFTTYKKPSDKSVWYYKLTDIGACQEYELPAFFSFFNSYHKLKE